MGKKTITLDMNRVEGDLELKLEIEDNVITNAWTIGTMYRGFEQIMINRAKTDGLVITPRVCGICGTAHLYCAVTALETAYQCPIATNGTRVRNICLMAEELQSDARHAFLMFTIDFCNERYKNLPGFAKIMEAFEVFKGRIYKEAVQETRKLLEIVAMFGGQWPHSSYMVPGGVTNMGNRRTIVKSLSIVDQFASWYEKSVLGCSLDRWANVQSFDDVEKWLDEKPEHRESAMGLFLRFGRDIGLQYLGRGHGNMLSYGVYFDPVQWQPPFGPQKTLRAAGFYDSETKQIETFSHSEIAEHVKHSWFQDYEGGKHPWQGETIPNYQPGTEKYSWAKAPRYKDKVVEVGALPELFIAGDPLMQSVCRREGTNVFSRQFARLHRPTVSLRMIRSFLLEIDKHFDEPFYMPPKEVEEGEGFGMVEAARGALGHWVKIKDGKIERYQIVTPTAWNASPRDSRERLGHWEHTLVGTVIEDENNPIELGHIIRSHDACLVCTVHFLKTNKKIRYGV